MNKLVSNLRSAGDNLWVFETSSQLDTTNLKPFETTILEVGYGSKGQYDVNLDVNRKYTTDDIEPISKLTLKVLEFCRTASVSSDSRHENLIEVQRRHAEYLLLIDTKQMVNEHSMENDSRYKIFIKMLEERVREGHATKPPRFNSFVQYNKGIVEVLEKLEDMGVIDICDLLDRTRINIKDLKKHLTSCP